MTSFFSTENLMYLAGNAFRIYAFYRLSNVFFPNKTCHRLIEWFSYLSFFLVNSICFLLFPIPLLTLATNILPLFAITLLHPSKWQTRLIATAIMYVTTMLCDTLIYACFRVLSVESILVNSGIASALFMFLVALFAEYRFKTKGRHTLNFLHMIAILVIPIGSIVIGVLTMEAYSPSMVAESLILLLINLLVFYLYDALDSFYAQKQERAMLQQQNRAYENQIRLFQQSQERIRFLRHDMKNHICQMEQFLKDGQYDELGAYLKCWTDAMIAEKPFSSSGEQAVDSLLNYKLAEAAKMGAVIDTDLCFPKELQIPAFDWNIILGNLLDNAMEALLPCAEKRLSLSMRYDSGVLRIRVKNNVSQEPQMHKGKFLSTKKDHHGEHGLGLQSIQSTLDKYHGVIQLSVKDSVFEAAAMLYISPDRLADSQSA